MAAKVKSSTILVSILLLGIAACGHPLIPRSVLDQNSPSPSSSPPSSPAAKQRLAVLGVDLYSSADYPLSVVQRDGARNLYYIKHVLGAQSVGIVWNLYSPSVHSDMVRASDITLSPPKIAVLTREALSEGLSVEYRPLIRVGPQWRWEGSIRPHNQKAWFRHFYDAELPYLRLAERLHINKFVVSTELRDLNSSNEWPSFFRRVKEHYHGIVSYTAFQGTYFSASGRLLPVHWLGVDPYPDLHLPDTATPHQLFAAWDGLFRQMPPAILARTTLEEVGFAGISGAYSAPQDWNRVARPNALMLARWFTAACTVVRKYHMRGIYFYEVNLLDNPSRPLTFPAFFVGKPGAQAIHSCRSILQG
jgi:glycosyl hydrolase family 113